jgi:predicted GNAT family N-acyltransferase
MTEPDEIVICQTSAEAIRPLRHAVLRAGLGPEAAVFDGDDEPTTRHIGAFNRDGQLVGCATIVRRLWHHELAWQLRGMAIDGELRGRGIGRLLLVQIERIVLEDGFSSTLWCNARTPAVGFYSAMGWKKIGDEFHIETAGPHFRMLKKLR